MSPQQVADSNKRWFVSNKDVDYDIERRFGKLVSTARSGTFDGWVKDPENGLALVILLDQFPRNLYRGQVSAFASDSKALGLARAMVEQGFLMELGYPERAFALMPYQHVESLELQLEGVSLYREQAEAAPGDWKQIMCGYADFADQHCKIIERFGRFPHRNKVLGRENTPEETEYLVSGGSRFGQ